MTMGSLPHMTNNSDSQPIPTQSLRSVGIREIVVVDANPERYADLVQAAQNGEVGLHFCVDGRSAIRLARRFRADIWLVSTDLPDLAGFDLLEMLSGHVMQGSVDPLRSGSRISLDRIGRGMRSGIFVVSDAYAIEEEQRALVAGAGYLVRPVTADVIRAMRTRSAAPGESAEVGG
jgi:PleD family two-component response regulator